MIFGAGGNDVLRGGPGNDILKGGRGNDLLRGGSGQDTARREPGQRTFSGALGNDVVRGGLGRDTVRGGNGNDHVWGGPGNDLVVGGPGSDTLFGNHGNDKLNAMDGVGGNDIANGGSGSTPASPTSGTSSSAADPAYRFPLSHNPCRTAPIGSFGLEAQVRIPPSQGRFGRAEPHSGGSLTLQSGRVNLVVREPLAGCRGGQVTCVPPIDPPEALRASWQSASAIRTSLGPTDPRAALQRRDDTGVGGRRGQFAGGRLHRARVPARPRAPRHLLLPRLHRPRRARVGSAVVGTALGQEPHVDGGPAQGRRLTTVERRRASGSAAS